MAERRMGAVLQMVDQNHRMAEEGHHRLRTDQRTLERRVETLEAAIRLAEVRFTKIETTPPDVAKLQWSSRTVVAVVLAAVGYAAGQWGLNAQLKSELKLQIEQSAKIQEERYYSQKSSTDDLRKRFELLQFEFGSLKETVLRQQRR